MNHKGSEGVVHIGTSPIAELRGWELSEEGSQIDDSVLADAWDTHQTGSNRWSGSATAFWDETDANGQEAINVGTKVGLTFYPEGTAGTSTRFVGTASPSTITRRAARNGMVEVDFNFVGDGALVQGTA